MPTELNMTARRTLVDEGTTLKGAIKSECPVTVKGTVDGELEVPELTVTERGRVQGTVVAQKVTSHGTLSGKVTAKEVELAGSVLSKTVIVADSLDIKLDSAGKSLEVTFGDCDLQVGEDPAARIKGDSLGDSKGNSDGKKQKPASPNPA